MLASDLSVRHSFSLDIFHVITFTQHRSESYQTYPIAKVCFQVFKAIFITRQGLGHNVDFIFKLDKCQLSHLSVLRYVQ